MAASTTDVPDSSIYASIQSSDASKLVLVLINKATTDRSAGVVIDHSTVYASAAVYTLTAAAGAKLVPGAPLTSVATNAFRYTMPSQSVSVLVPSP